MHASALVILMLPRLGFESHPGQSGVTRSLGFSGSILTGALKALRPEKPLGLGKPGELVTIILRSKE